MTRKTSVFDIFTNILKILRFDRVYFYNKLIFSIMPMESVPNQIRSGILS